jgi:hypothetical protein
MPDVGWCAVLLPLIRHLQQTACGYMTFFLPHASGRPPSTAMMHPVLKVSCVMAEITATAISSDRWTSLPDWPRWCPNRE